MSGSKRSESHKLQDRINPFTPSAQKGPILGIMPPGFELCFDTMSPGFVPGQANIIVSADDNIPPEEIGRILQALSDIPLGLIEQVLSQMLGNLGGTLVSFDFGEFPKGSVIEIGEDNYTVVPDANGKE